MFPYKKDIFLHKFDKAIAIPYGHLVVINKPNMIERERLIENPFRKAKHSDSASVVKGLTLETSSCNHDTSIVDFTINRLEDDKRHHYDTNEQSVNIPGKQENLFFR